MPSKFGFQPKELPPLDFPKFLDYQKSINTAIQQSLYEVSKPINIYDKKSKSYNNGEPRNRNWSK